MVKDEGQFGHAGNLIWLGKGYDNLLVNGYAWLVPLCGPASFLVD